jgi:hypothetical protein
MPGGGGDFAGSPDDAAGGTAARFGGVVGDAGGAAVGAVVGGVVGDAGGAAVGGAAGGATGGAAGGATKPPAPGDPATSTPDASAACARSAKTMGESA